MNSIVIIENLFSWNCLTKRLFPCIHRTVGKINQEKLNKSDFIATIVEKLYKLQSKNQDDITKEYYFEAEKFLVRKQEISQIEQSRKLKIVYPEYQQKNELFLLIFA